MHLVFLYGQPASGKLTIAKALAQRTGLALFHNHLVVDAVGAVFPFGSESFNRLRERFWLDTLAEAAKTGRSLIFTFAPEPTVAPDFARRARTMIEASEGKVIFVALTVPPAEQERRLAAPDRSQYGKLRSPELLRRLAEDFALCLAAMPAPALTIDTAAMTPDQAAATIATLLPHPSVTVPDA
ncbi:MAG: AAA family ATPase [Parvibaculaceae bacterium]